MWFFIIIFFHICVWVKSLPGSSQQNFNMLKNWDKSVQSVCFTIVPCAPCSVPGCCVSRINQWLHQASAATVDSLWQYVEVKPHRPKHHEVSYAEPLVMFYIHPWEKEENASHPLWKTAPLKATMTAWHMTTGIFFLILWINFQLHRAHRSLLVNLRKLVCWVLHT